MKPITKNIMVLNTLHIFNVNSFQKKIKLHHSLSFLFTAPNVSQWRESKEQLK